VGSALTQTLTLSYPVTDTRMSDEIVHNLDGCEISLVGDDLDPERESLLLDMASLQQRGLELTNTSAYLTIAGQWAKSLSSFCMCVPLPMSKYLGNSEHPPTRPRDVAKCHFVSSQLEDPVTSRLYVEEGCWGRGSRGFSLSSPLRSLAHLYSWFHSCFPSSLCHLFLLWPSLP
jgi:hypothetical protein